MALHDPCPQLADCRQCPRLAAHLDGVRETHPRYHAQPVSAWGSARARLLVVGLAPGMHGANRTGRPFTGDASGAFLFAALMRHGFSDAAEPGDARLRNVRITNAVKCLPPNNRPIAAEIRQCSRYLRQEIAELWRPGLRRPRCVLALGVLAHQAVGHALGERLTPFRHGQVVALRPSLWLANSYHPSRQNTNTGRLSAAMLDDVLGLVRAVLETH